MLKNFNHKILIEPFLKSGILSEVKINVYCFHGKSKIIIKFFDENKMSIWNEKFIPMEKIFNFSEENVKYENINIINQTFDRNIRRIYTKHRRNRKSDGAKENDIDILPFDEVKSISIEEITKLSEKLAVNFKFVRVDWMIYKNKLYFEELTFTPYSGFFKTLNIKYDKILKI